MGAQDLSTTVRSFDEEQINNKIDYEIECAECDDEGAGTWAAYSADTTKFNFDKTYDSESAAWNATRVEKWGPTIVVAVVEGEKSPEKRRKIVSKHMEAARKCAQKTKEARAKYKKACDERRNVKIQKLRALYEKGEEEKFKCPNKECGSTMPIKHVYTPERWQRGMWGRSELIPDKMEDTCPLCRHTISGIDTKEIAALETKVTEAEAEAKELRLPENVYALVKTCVPE